MGEKWNHLIINVKLCYRSVNGKQKYHVIIPEGERFKWDDFMKLKNNLRSKFPSNYNKELYLAGTPRWFEEGSTSYTKDQPVFEYDCEAKDLMEAITAFAQTDLNLGDRKFAYSTIDYDFVSSMKEVPLDMLHIGETLGIVQ